MRLRVGLILLLVLNLVAAVALFSPETVNQLSVSGPVPAIGFWGTRISFSSPIKVGVVGCKESDTGSCGSLYSSARTAASRWQHALNLFGSLYNFPSLATVTITLGSGGQITIKYGTVQSGGAAMTSPGRVITANGCDSTCMTHEMGHALGLNELTRSATIYDPVTNRPVTDIMQQLAMSFNAQISTLDCYALATGQGTLPSSIPYMSAEGTTIPEFPSTIILSAVVLMLTLVIVKRQPRWMRRN